MQVAARSLWLPEWARAPLMFAHLKKSASSGHLLKTSTGHLSKACPSGGTSACTDCPTGSGPTDFLVTISGATHCPGVNGSYSCIYMGPSTPCLWTWTNFTNIVNVLAKPGNLLHVCYGSNSLGACSGGGEWEDTITDCNTVNISAMTNTVSNANCSSEWSSLTVAIQAIP